MKRLMWTLPLLVLCGCAGAKCKLSARSVEPPVSCTPCVFDATGRIHEAATNEIVSHFTLTKTKWTVFWKSVPLGGEDWDISPELNAQLSRTRGNAIVNVMVTVEGCNFFQWYLAALIPVIPSYVTVKVDGDVAQINGSR
jgi:hypothetical protein